LTLSIMTTPQPGILAPLPGHARYLAYSLREPAALPAALLALREHIDGTRSVAGFGLPVADACKRTIAGLRPPLLGTAPGLPIEAAPAALWLWLRGGERGELLHRSRHLTQALAPAFCLDECWDAFKYEDGRDLSGYVDGTENPVDDDAVRTAIVADGPLAGSSFVAVQRWRHDFARCEAMAQGERDHAVGRRQSDNEELEDAPESAHVKRTAQESFSPEAFVLRRSMPWAQGLEGGLMFTAFGASYDAFEAQLKRMIGSEDGIVDALFKFTQPVSGAYFWCPPMKDGNLDLTQLGL